jgi:hypothetical protein
MRWGYPLEYFKTGESKSYVFCHVDNYVEDYNDKYDDNKSLIELLGTIIYAETKDQKYAWKVVKILAKKLGVEKDLRERPLGSDEWFDMVLKEKKAKSSRICNRSATDKAKRPKSANKVNTSSKMKTSKNKKG